VVPFSVQRKANIVHSRQRIWNSRWDKVSKTTFPTPVTMRSNGEEIPNVVALYRPNSIVNPHRGLRPAKPVSYSLLGFYSQGYR
jgi:hypothetical protein